MANVYSIRLYASGGSVTLGEYNSAPVPAGYVWVVRSITAYLDQLWFFYAQGIHFRVSTLSGSYLAGVTRPGVSARRAYQWDMHQVLNAGETIHVSTWDASWNFAVSGYQLTLP